MKKSIPVIISVLFLFLNSVFAGAPMDLPAQPEPQTKNQTQLRLIEISKRVEAIKSIDRSNLNRQEKKALRQELRSLKKETALIGAGGVLLTVASLLVVILLLILLL